MKKLLLMLAVLTVVFTSCKKDDKDQPNNKIFKGPIAMFQHGKALTWYEVDNSNKPLRIAVSIDDDAMNSLDVNVPGSDGHSHENVINLPLHPKALATPFKFIGLGWNPHGHEPNHIYGLPHFDFHFNLLTEAEVMAIPAYEVDSSLFLQWPAAPYFPANYFNPGGGVPKMGAHWLDFTTPELNGAQFTQTFIFGSYAGQVSFYEPMITKAFIDANSSFERIIPQPSKYQKDGYYPTKMRIAQTAGWTNIILEEFVYRTAS